MKCIRCNQESEKEICDVCAKAETTRKITKSKKNTDWITIAEEAEIPLYSQQPEETDDEFRLWLSFRDMYPHKKPTIRGASEACQVSYGTAKNIAAKWDWKIRLQAWAKHCADLTAQQRSKSIVDMNLTHLDMAKKLQDKLKVAIDNIDPYSLAPKDINALVKTAADLERTALRDDSEEWKPNIAPAGSKDLKESTTKKEDIAEVMQILMAAGLGQGKKVGVEQTTRVIVDGD